MDSKQRYTCPCCRYKTFNREDHLWDICEVCFWQSCPIQNVDPECFGANRITLNEARENFKNYGACEKSSLPHVRPPREDEMSNDAHDFNKTRQKY